MVCKSTSSVLLIVGPWVMGALSGNSQKAVPLPGPRLALLPSQEGTPGPRAKVGRPLGYPTRVPELTGRAHNPESPFPRGEDPRSASTQGKVGKEVAWFPRQVKERGSPRSGVMMMLDGPMKA